jgi:3,4-dihydroxy 2-butanone 4-phosphate synthase/GTP cyclohydrolase II
VIVEIMSDDGSMARRPELEKFARAHGLRIGTIADLIRYRLRNERSVERIADRSVQTEAGEFRLLAYQDHVHRDVHLALVRGDLAAVAAPLVRVHLADTLLDVIGVASGPRRWTLRAALQRIAAEGTGVVVVLRQSESPRELADAVRALEGGRLGRGGADGPPVLRTYGIGAQILKDLGLRRMRVLSAPKQMHGLSAFDLQVENYVDSST